VRSFRKCTKSEFETFVKNYPNPLDVDVAQMYHPPVRTYNDFSDGNVWPHSIVAKVFLNSVVGAEDEYEIPDSEDA